MNHTHSQQTQRGLSLIELLVAMALGLIITAGILNIVLSGSRTNTRMQEVANLTENGRYASELLRDEIQLAGYYGLLDDYPPAPGALPDPCKAADFETGLGLPVQGYNNVPSGQINGFDGCSGTALAGTDVLVTRRVSTQLSGAGDPASSYYLQASNLTYKFDNTKANLTLKKMDGVTTEDIRIYRPSIFFVNDNFELIRLELIGAAFTPVVIAEGVENFQVEYGIDNNGDGAVANADYVAAPTAAQWPDVVSIKIHLLLRTDVPGHTDTKSYSFGALSGGTITPGGNFKRRLFQSSNRIINVSMKREG